LLSVKCHRGIKTASFGTLEFCLQQGRVISSERDM
jgi:hypothetical protein